RRSSDLRLLSMGMPYDSDAGRGICGALTALLNGQAYLTSSEIAADIGPFAGYKENEQPMLRVMQMHRDAVHLHDAQHRLLVFLVPGEGADVGGDLARCEVCLPVEQGGERPADSPPRVAVVGHAHRQ